MHELSIASGIADIALSVAREHFADHVLSVEIEIGQGAGVEPSALEFAWDSVIRDTILENAPLIMLHIPLLLRCRKCSHEYNPAEPFEPCPKCGQPNGEIIAGKELRVISVEI